MNAYGGDRVRADGDTIVLSSRLPKGWTARVERTLNQSEFPGTAVLWDDAFFEVIKVEPLPAGVRYTLQPWPDHHAMRVSERYDAESEARRADEWRAALARERKRRTVGALALITGHLPAVVQERLASELGILAARLTFASLLSEGLAIGALAAYVVIEVMAGRPLPIRPILIGGYLAVETLFRYMVNWTQSRPIGSAAGVLAYILYWLLTGCRKETSPFEAPAGHAITIAETPDDQKLSDAMTMREPFATLLPARDQEVLRARHGYDYRRSSTTVASILLTFAILGIVTSLRGRAFLSLIIASGIALEQIIRLTALRRGPTGSVLGWLVRPLMRNLL